MRGKRPPIIYLTPEVTAALYGSGCEFMKRHLCDFYV
ncbi:hypothetical protein DNTS_028528 [Danionella cerebrum]|uniref:Uncharacterized protein n=1 Tax=Danionella cerebrum TaxID=2873325 RepID=A0A553QM67_9TELE|nr:hypothetical protein DNTS_028528 [Danionella translucida]